MGSITTHNRQNTLIFHSETSLGKQTLAYLKSSDYDIRTIDISESKITGTQWIDISKQLNMPLSQLVEQEHPNFKKNYDSPTNLSSTDWIKVLQKHPIVLRYPIVINSHSYHIIETPSQIAKLLENEQTSKDARSKK